MQNVKMRRVASLVEGAGPAGVILSLYLLFSAFSAQPSGQTVSYPVIYVAAPRAGDAVPSPFADVALPYALTGNSDLRVHYPGGRDDLLVDVGPQEAIADPSVSLD